MEPSFNFSLPEIKNNNTTSLTHDALLKDEAVNKLKIPGDTNIYAFKMSDFDFLPNGIISSDKCIVKKYFHRPSNQIMAIKFVHIPMSVYYDKKKENEMKKLIREIKIHQQLNYAKNIVRLYGFCISEGDALICMQYMDMSLKEFYIEVHKKHGHFPGELMGVIGVSIIHAFQDLNRAGIIHRDIKPSNILIDWTTEIKLCDFGESRILENDLATSIVGTVAYWPPERIGGQKNAYDNRSDIWSLGITLAELAYGKFPFEDDDGQDLDNYIKMMNFILTMNPDEFIRKCFTRHNYTYTVEQEFALLCLRDCEERPNYESLLSTLFYNTYLSFVRKSVMAKYLQTISRINTDDPILKLKINLPKIHNFNSSIYSKGFYVPERYIPGDIVRSGARGIVMCAIDKTTNNRVAIKQQHYPYNTSEIVYREFVLLQKIKHENIIYLIDAFTSDSSDVQFLYFVIPYLSYPLKHLIHERQMVFKSSDGRQSLSYILYQIIAGINYLHSLGIVHCDLSPDCIIVNKDLRLKIAHLGLAQFLDKNRLELRSYKQSINIYTDEEYRSPEVILGMKYNHKADIWSIGCIFAEIITGDVFLYRCGSFTKLVQIITHVHKISFNKLPKELQKWLTLQTKYDAQPSSNFGETITWQDLFPDSLFPQNYLESKKSNSNWLQFLNKKLKKSDSAKEGYESRGRDLISKMLNIDFHKRISSDEALKHFFLHPYCDKPIPTYQEQINFDELLELKGFDFNQWNNLIYKWKKEQEF